MTDKGGLNDIGPLLRYRTRRAVGSNAFDSEYIYLGSVVWHAVVKYGSGDPPFDPSASFRSYALDGIRA